MVRIFVIFLFCVVLVVLTKALQSSDIHTSILRSTVVIFLAFLASMGIGSLLAWLGSHRS